MKGYLFLFFNVNKNYFFERYKFLKKDKLEFFYNIHFIIKSIMVAMILLCLSYKFSEYRNILLSIPFFMITSKLLGLDSKKWGHYYRNDWIQAYPHDLKRFVILLVTNFIIDFFILDNILLYILIQMIVYDFNAIITIYIIVALLYVLVLSVQLVLMQANIIIKKIYSLLVYLSSSVVTGIMSYISIGSVIKFIQSIVLKEDMVNFITTEIQHIFLNMQFFFKNYNYHVLGIIVIFSVLNIILLLINFMRNNFQNGKQNIQARMDDFLFIKFYKLLFELLYNNHKEYMKKELGLIVELYTFNYKEYLNTFFIDRSVFTLLGILCVLTQFNHFSIPYIAILLLLVFFYIDISSGINVKLLSNMSFVADYNTIQVCNSTNTSIQHLIRNKLRLFRVIRFPSLLCYLVLSCVYTVYFGMDSILFVFLVLFIIIFWCLLPKIFMSNNLIYIRSNYDQFKKYIEDSTIILRDMKEFFLIELYYRYMFFCIIMYMVMVFIINSSSIIYIFWIILLSEFVLMVMLYLIMSRVVKNICNALEMGDYSVDVARIFKR